MPVYKKVPGCETVNISTLEFDTKPTPGSYNPVTSDGVAGSVTLQSNNIAEAFSASSTYAIGDVVIGPDGKLYQCTTAVSTAGEWDATDWTETSMGGQVAQVYTSMDEKLAEMEIAILSNNSPAANTLRFAFSKKDYDPTVAGVGTGGTWKKLNTTETNVWDWTKNGTNFATAFKDAFKSSDNLVSVIAAGDTSSVTSFDSFFFGCSSIVYVCDFNTSAATNINHMFRATSITKSPNINTGNVTNAESAYFGSAIEEVPLLNTGKMVDVDYMFINCFNVKSGAKALYEQMTTQTTPPSSHTQTFQNCGRDTTTGAAELAQIPASWGGTGPEPAEP